MPYDDFKSYIQDKYCGIIIDAIQEFVEKIVIELKFKI